MANDCHGTEVAHEPAHEIIEFPFVDSHVYFLAFLPAFLLVAELAPAESGTYTDLERTARNDILRPPVHGANTQQCVCMAMRGAAQ